MPSPGFFFRYSVSSPIEWIGLFASTAIAKLSLASVVTGVKSLTGSKESCLKMCRAAASVELAGVIMMVYPSGFARATYSVAMFPCAPTLFSTRTGLPASRASLSL